MNFDSQMTVNSKEGSQVGWNLNDQVYVSRVIQYHGKRVNIRLEAVFWKILESMAKDSGCKLNLLVNNLISDENAALNQTAYLRFRAVSWLNSRLCVASEQLFLQKTEVRALLSATRLPGFIFSSFNNLSRFNKAFHEWLNANVTGGVEANDISRIRISFRRSFAAIKSDLERGNGQLNKEPCAILIPGYVFPISINMVVLNNYSKDGHVYMGLFNT